MNQQGAAAHRKAGFRIARSGGVVRESSIRRRAAGIETLRQRDSRRAALTLNALDISELQRAREHDIASQRIIGRIAHEYPGEAQFLGRLSVGCDGLRTELR